MDLFNFFLALKFGEAVALYFAFLNSYTRALLFISVAGLANFYFGQAYSILYSSFLFLWSLIFVEYWRVRERIYSATWGCLGSVRVEHHRPRYVEGHPWWKRELKVLVSVPVIALFASVLAVLLTAIFVLEAFVTTLYTGPGHRYIVSSSPQAFVAESLTCRTFIQSFAPTIIFTIAIPRFLAIYRARAQRLTQWENHKHQSAFDTSFTTKTFALSSVVAYLGLALSAFVYVPFGETAINQVQRLTSSTLISKAGKGGHTLFVSDQSAARAKLDPSRLQDQMFAYTVTNQATDFFTEVGLPFLTRAFTLVRSGKCRSSLFVIGMGAPKKKRVGFEDDKSGAARDEREFLERVRREVSLPQYELFGDYDEMVTQFGYIALWSTIWPLAPGQSPFISNVLKLTFRFPQ
jgi:anoctamin-10